MIKKDCSGLACPQPVLEARDMIAQNPGESIEIIVDNEAARQNVTRFMESQGYMVTSVQTEHGRISVKGVPGACAIEAAGHSDKSGGSERILLFIPSDTLGEGDPDLGSRLMLNFIKTLDEFGPDLWRIVFVNSGVKLAIRDAETLAPLKALEERGVSILVCGTCLEFFKLMAEKAVGETTNMLDIVTSMHLASRVIRI